MTWAPRPIEKAPVERLTGVGYMGSFGRPKSEPEPIRVPSTWTALAAEIRRLADTPPLGGAAPRAEQMRQMVQLAETLADLIIDQRAR